MAESSKDSITKNCILNLSGYYLNYKLNYFKLCSTNCEICDNYENCKSCKSGFFLIKTSLNTIVCSDNILKYFSVLGQNYYEQCAENCETCIDSATKCLSCNKSQSYIPIKNTNECVKTCPDGYWLNFIEKNCQLCHPSCKKCLDNNNYCLESSEGYFPLKENKSMCYNECPSNYKFNSIEKYYEINCINNCKLCTTPTNCFNCIENYYLFSFSSKISCVINCPEGFFNDGINFKCQTCPNYCKTCQNIDECLSCKNEYFYFGENKICLKNCPNKYYSQIAINDINIIKINESKNICRKCNSKCSVCTGSEDYCLSCEQGYLYLAKNNECLIDCPQGFYKNLISNECLACNYTCQECKGNRINDCIKCNEDQGMKLNNGLCMKDIGNSKIICPIGFIEVEQKCVSFKSCIQTFNSFMPKLFSIEIYDLIVEVNLNFKNECNSLVNKFSIFWDKENPYYNNSYFSNNNKVLTIKNEFLKEGDFKFTIRLFYESNEIANLIISSKFQIDKVIFFLIFR